MPEGEVCLHGVHDLGNDGGQLGDDGRGHDLIHAGFHEFLLAPDPAYIPFLVAVAHIGDCRFAVHVLHARLQVYEQAAVIIPGVFIVHALFHIDIYAADGIYDALE